MKTFKLKNLIVLIIVINAFPTVNFAQLSMGLSSSVLMPISHSQIREYGDANGYLTCEFGYVDQERSLAYGAALHQNFGKIALLTEVQYTSTENRFYMMDYRFEELEPHYMVEKTKYIKVPIAGLVNFNRFHIGVGPVFNFNIESDDMIARNSEFKDKNIKLKPSFQFLAGLKFLKHCMINVKYEMSLTAIGDDYFYNNVNSRIKNGINNFSVGIYIFP